MTTERPAPYTNLDHLALLDQLILDAEQLHGIAEGFNRQAHATMLDRLRTDLVGLVYLIPTLAESTEYPPETARQVAVDIGILLDQYDDDLHMMGPLFGDEEEEEDEDEDEEDEDEGAPDDNAA